MLNAFQGKSKRCCRREHENIVRDLGHCEMESNNADERHHCYRRAAKAGGDRARQCMAEGNL